MTPSRRMLAAVLPASLMVCLLVAGWSSWLQTAPLHQHVKAARVLLGGISEAFGRDVGLFLRPCPSLLSGATLAAQLVNPLTLLLFVGLLPVERSLSLRARLWTCTALPLAVMFVAHLVGLVATVVSVPNQQLATAAPWALSLWLRASAVLVPMFALGLALARLLPSRGLRVLALALALAALGETALSHHAPEFVLRSLLMNLAPARVALGVLVSLAAALGLLVMPELLTRLAKVRFTKVRKVDATCCPSP